MPILDPPALRPEFTDQVFRQMAEARTSYNIVGPKGTGRAELLHDLQRMARAMDYRECLIDLKIVQHDFHHFLAQLRRIVGVPEGFGQSVSEILARAIPPGQLVLLLLDDFDAMLGNREHQFPEAFFADLNDLKTNKLVRLCCITSEPYLRFPIYSNGRKLDGSPLDLTVLRLPKLSTPEIRARLERRLADCPGWRDESRREHVVACIHRHVAPFEFLQKIVVEDYLIGGSAANEARWLADHRELYKRAKSGSNFGRNAKEAVEWVFDQFGKIRFGGG